MIHASTMADLRQPIPPGTRIGHVHLKVADLDRAIGFYRDVLGFELQQRLGAQAAFLSAGGYHHHIGLNTWESAGGDPPAPGTTGRAGTARGPAGSAWTGNATSGSSRAWSWSWWRCTSGCATPARRCW